MYTLVYLYADNDNDKKILMNNHEIHHNIKDNNNNHQVGNHNTSKNENNEINDLCELSSS